MLIRVTNNLDVHQMNGSRKQLTMPQRRVNSLMLGGNDQEPRIMKALKNSIWTLFAMLPVAATAAEVPASEVLYIAPWVNRVDVQMSAPYVNTEACGQADYYRLDLQNDAGAKTKLATLLAAFAQGKYVGLSIAGCLGDRAKIVGVRLYK